MSYTPGLWITWCDESGYMPDTFRIHPSREEAEAVIRAANDATDGNVTMYMAPYSHLRIAPELVAACERTLTMLTHLTTVQYSRGGDREMRDILTAALARVKGE